MDLEMTPRGAWSRPRKRQLYFKGSGPGLGSKGLRSGPAPAGLAVVGLGTGSGYDLILSSETTAVRTCGGSPSSAS